MKKIFGVFAFIVLMVGVAIAYPKGDYFRIFNKGKYLQIVNVKCNDGRVYEKVRLSSPLKPAIIECSAKRITLLECQSEACLTYSDGFELKNTGYSDIIVKDKKMRVDD